MNSFMHQLTRCIACNLKYKETTEDPAKHVVIVDKWEAFDCMGVKTDAGGQWSKEVPTRAASPQLKRSNAIGHGANSEHVLQVSEERALKTDPSFGLAAIGRFTNA